MIPSTVERVPEHTAEHVNEQIAEQTKRNVACFKSQGPAAIRRRLGELDREWDIERVLEANAGGVMLFASLRGLRGGRHWFLLSGLVGGFLLQHAIQGWCPPLPLFRRLGFRTSREIDEERQALMAALNED